MSAEQALAALASDGHAGLDTGTAAQRLRQHGPNALPEPPRRSLIGLFARQFKSPLIGILFAAAVLAVALGHHTDALVILAVVLVNALIGSRAGGPRRALDGRAATTGRAHGARARDGREAGRSRRAIWCRATCCCWRPATRSLPTRACSKRRSCRSAEAALTGESVPVTKSAAALPEANGLADRHNMVYSGTHVTAGRARAVVVATGSSTEVGRIADLTAQARRAQDAAGRAHRALRPLADVGRAGVVRRSCWRWVRCARLPLDDVLMVAISQMVSMVPEGLPVAMTIALAVGMQRMAERGAIVRRLGCRRDARLDLGDLQRQDRHADAQRDDRHARCGCPAASMIDGAGQRLLRRTAPS